MRKTLVLCTVLLLASFATAQGGGQGQAQGKMAHGDMAFAETTAMHNTAEIELSQLAAQRATNAQVKQFAQQMVTDHTKAGQMLDSIVGKKGMTAPKMSPDSDRRFREHLEKASGADFDMMYMKHMFVAHTKDLSSFQLYTQMGKDPELKSFAQQQVPILQRHFGMAGGILKSMGISAPNLGAQEKGH